MNKKSIISRISSTKKRKITPVIPHVDVARMEEKLTQLLESQDRHRTRIRELREEVETLKWQAKHGRFG